MLYARRSARRVQSLFFRSKRLSRRDEHTRLVHTMLCTFRRTATAQLRLCPFLGVEDNFRRHKFWRPGRSRQGERERMTATFGGNHTCDALINEHALSCHPLGLEVLSAVLLPWSTCLHTITSHHFKVSNLEAIKQSRLWWQSVPLWQRRLCAHLSSHQLPRHPSKSDGAKFG